MTYQPTSDGVPAVLNVTTIDGLPSDRRTNAPNGASFYDVREGRWYVATDGLLEPAQPPQIVPPSAPAKSHRGLLIAIAAIPTALILLVAGILYAAGVFTGGGLSKASAERACRTAVGSEWQKRVDVASVGMATTVVPSVQDIEMLDTYEVDGGWASNATVHYTLTTGFIAPVEGTIDLTCTATGSDDAPTTAVTNRS